MTLNFSHRPIFPPLEDNFVRLREGISDNKPLRRFNWEFEEDRGEGIGNGSGNGNVNGNGNDILDLLPSDPFGMNIGATFTAITGWIEDLEMDGLNFIWNNAIQFQSDERWGWGYSDAFDGGFVFADDLSSFCDKYCKTVSCQLKENAVVDVGSSSSGSGGGGDPHEALLYALGYLGVHELLSVEGVCRSLHDAVQNDSLLWRNVLIDQPLSEKIDDDTLLRLTNRAQGNLQCLSLVECSKVTDDGLKRVLQNNPKLIKLSVPGCTRLSVEGIVNNLKVFKSFGVPGLKLLRIGGRYGVTQQHFEELKLLLGVDGCTEPKTYKPRFYRSGHTLLSFDDDRPIDIETCPRCENLRLVYDCPAEHCIEKESSSQLCRACAICIARCDRCGRCINDNEYEETFCLDLLCSECLKEEDNCTEQSSINEKMKQNLQLHG